MKIGIEIHQRLETHKLFCQCPSKLMENAMPNAIVQRRLHPVFSELGEVDEASMQEFKKDRTYEYSVYKACDCLVEMDEEPPHRMNADALNIALEVGMHLNAKPVAEVHVMRKIVIDGSNTAGFQRTAVIALNGHLETSKGSVRIPLIAIEEESAGIIGATEKKVSYKLDRLGIPLVEISTEPDIKDGQHLLEVAEKIGMMLRATGKVARGLGTIRQDVNISIEGGSRVEIKGAQDLKQLPLLVENEVKRQKELIGIYNEIEKRGAKTQITSNFVDLSPLFAKTSSTLISTGIQKGQVVLAVKLPMLGGLIGKEVQSGRRFGTELSDYAKTAGTKGIIHSDEDISKYNIIESEANEIKKSLGVSSKDAFVIVVAEEHTARNALMKVIGRILSKPVLEETRRANPDATSTYMRPLPGKARMYPETDIPPIRISEKMMLGIAAVRSESMEEKKKMLHSLLNAEMAEKMLKSRDLPVYEALVKGTTLATTATVIATTLMNTAVSIRREGFDTDKLKPCLPELFKAYEKGLFVKSAIPEILKLISTGKTLGQALDDGNLRKITGPVLKKIAEENGFDVAKIMQKYRLRVDPADIAKLEKH